MVQPRWGAGVIAALVLLSSCSSGDAPASPSRNAASPAESSPQEAAPSQQTAPSQQPQSTAPGAWNPNLWEPTVQVNITRLSEDERQAWRSDYLDGFAADLDGPAPEVALERWVHPRAEWDAVMTTCMTDSGFPIEVEDGSIDYPAGPPPADQLSAWDLAWFTCNARFTPDPDYSQDWTEAQIGLVYDYWDQYFIPCMEAHGVPVNRSQQPSRATYISTFFTPERTWWPDQYLTMLPQAQQEQLEPVCPPYPPDEAFFGS